MRRKVRVRNGALAAAMAKRGLTNYRLAELCNIHSGSVSALLNNRRDPRQETAAAIARVLGTTPEALGFIIGKEVAR